MPSKKPETLTNRIRRLRFDNGEMTQQGLAERIGVTRQTIIALEAGKCVPSLLLAFRLAAAFGIGSKTCFSTRAARPTQRSGEGSPATGER
jgi:putative transcriptional regulator